MDESKGLFVATIILGLVFDVILCALTRQFWSVTVHQVLIELITEAGWGEKIIWAAVDAVFAVIIGVGIGILLAAALVYPIYYRLTGKR